MASAADITRQIKQANDIVDVIAGYLPVQRAGKMFKCVCPFHDDHRPSLTINREWQNYKCWACGADGDVFTFVEKYEKVNFREARAILARRGNVKLDDDSPEQERKNHLYRLMGWAQQAYQQVFLEGDEGTDARTYVGERKIAGSLVRQFGIGYSPNLGDWLARKAEKEGQDLEALEELGLLLKRDNAPGFFDRFRERVIFPIRDAQGRTIAFGGRILPTSHLANRTGKYINSPDTPLFNKSEVIYGLDLARHSAGKDGYLAVVEGYTDVMMAHHHGCTSVVATMGTALTASHVSQLKRYAPKVILVYDADAGGMTGVDRALELFVGQDVELAVVSLPDQLDPADLLTREGGAGEFQRCLATAKDALEFKLDALLAKSDGGIEGMRRIVDAVLGVMAAAPPVPQGNGQLKQELILNRLAHRLGVKQNVIWARFRELQTQRRQADRKVAERARTFAPQPTEPVRAAGAPDPLARQLLQVLLAEPALVSQAIERVPAEFIVNPDARRIIDEIYFLAGQGQSPDVDALRVRLLDRPDLLTAVLRLEQVGRTLTERPRWLDKVAGEFESRRLKSDKAAMKGELASAAGNFDRELELLRQLQGRGRKTA